MPEPFARRYRDAVADPQLAANLLTFQRGWRTMRDARFDAASTSGAPDFDDLRARLAAAKDRVLADHETYIEQFSRMARANGVIVHRAADGDAAAAIVASICRERGGSLIKTKSMVSEEIDLNHRLAAQGIAAIETDVGEWIMQLRGETPAHMVMPAIHLNRRQIAATLRDATGHPVSDEDVADQVRTVREALRPEFLSAHVGLTGANALIANTGSIMLVTNEGNEGLLTAIVDVQVVVAGIEKLLPGLDDAATQLRLLARSATGQAITTYTTFITAPHDGQELHVVLLDNGRSAMRADPEFSDALRCIRCAACASVCPPYAAVGGQVFGYIYSGAIGLVNTPFHNGLDNAAGPQSLCVSCNACQDVCPVDIPLPAQILAVRRRVVEQRGVGALKRVVFAVWRRRWLFNAVFDVATWLSAPLRRNGELRLPRPRAHRWRTVPAPAVRPAHRLIPAHTPGRRDGPLAHSAARGQRVALFVQCLTDRFSPEVAAAAVRLVAACGADVVVPRAQHCCGLPMFDSGDWPTARVLARHTIAALESSDADWIVSTANSCVVAVVHEYESLFKEDPAWARRARALAARTVDLATFLDRVAQLPDGALADAPADHGPYTYHPFCQTRTVLRADGSARRLLQDVCGIQLRELTEANICCGFGGSTSMTAPEVGRAIAERKLGNVDGSGATTLVTDNPGCVLHLRAAASARKGRPLRARHLAEVLAEQLDGVDARERQAAGASPGRPTPGSAQKRS
ncbi:MAG TPA: LUD domain-containing protein [Candidatus Dormibacteraeota bacterium]|jgi:iron-sulfur cluster protein|nr:LUD domain-containing protein [Candidatus Dormibacteraeota bacterium]